jgi:beta-lactamase superfamily II metal-dependent hydrolase
MNPLLNTPEKIWLNCIKFSVPTNLYGHPHAETMEILDKYDIPSLITWQSGAVIVDTKSNTVSVTGYGK